MKVAGSMIHYKEIKDKCLREEQEDADGFRWLLKELVTFNSSWAAPEPQKEIHLSAEPFVFQLLNMHWNCVGFSFLQKMKIWRWFNRFPVDFNVWPQQSASERFLKVKTQTTIIHFSAEFSGDGEH